MGLIERIFGGQGGVETAALYDAVVAEARAPGWYREGGVPDTIDGRFDTLALVLSLVLLRMEALGPAARGPSARLAERFVTDIDGQLRETGFGDVVIGKQVGALMGALGGRLGAYRDGLSAGALVRNLWRGAEPGADALAAVTVRAEALKAGLAAVTLDDLAAGRLA